MRGLVRTTVVFAMTLMLGVGAAWAQAKVTITREESKPQKLEVKAGEEVRWVNGSGGTAHVAFAGASTRARGGLPRDVLLPNRPLG